MHSAGCGQWLWFNIRTLEGMLCNWTEIDVFRANHSLVASGDQHLISPDNSSATSWDNLRRVKQGIEIFWTITEHFIFHKSFILQPKMLMTKTLTKLFCQVKTCEKQFSFPIGIFLQNTSFILNKENMLENYVHDKAFCRGLFAVTVARLS